MADQKKGFPKAHRYAWIALLFLISIAFSIIYWASPSVKKSDLAKSYDVSVRTLMKWIKLFCPQVISAYYVGSKKQKIKLKPIIHSLGRAEDYPKDGKGRILNNRDAIQRAFNIGQDTLARCIKKLEKPEQQIGMSLATYKRLHTYPPKHSLLLVEVVKEKYPMKR